MSVKILCVDDEENVLTGLQRALRKEFQVDVAVGGEAGLRRLETDGPYAVVMADMQMPVMNGIAFLKRVEDRWADTVRLMLTGNADQKTAVDAVNLGHIFRFLNKPCDPELLTRTLQAAVRQYRLVIAERELLEQTLNGCVKLLTDTLAMTDPAAFGHAQELREMMRRFAHYLSISQTWDLELAAMLAPIGTLALPGAILQRSREGQQLSGLERDMLARVPQTGADLLAHIPRLATVAQIVRYQLKDFDGGGHPIDAIAGEEIPMGARILRILNQVLMIERKKVPRYKALESLRLSPGCFDPKMVEAVTGFFDLALAKEGGPTVRRIGVAELKVGDHLHAGIQTRDGTLIVGAGITITEMHLQRVRNFAELSGLREPIDILG